jgi:hypothetical protein
VSAAGTAGTGGVGGFGISDPHRMKKIGGDHGPGFGKQRKRMERG